MSKHTPEPWRWSGTGIVAGSIHRPEHILWPGNSIDPDSLDPPVGPNETGPRWWSALLGACGKNAEAQAHFNGPRMTDCVNACGGYSRIDGRWVKTHDRLTNPDKEIKALMEVVNACEKLRSQWTPQHVATTALDFAVVDVILAIAALKAGGEGKNG